MEFLFFFLSDGGCTSLSLSADCLQHADNTRDGIHPSVGVQTVRCRPRPARLFVVRSRFPSSFRPRESSESESELESPSVTGGGPGTGVIAVDPGAHRRRELRMRGRGGDEAGRT